MKNIISALKRKAPLFRGRSFQIKKLQTPWVMWGITISFVFFQFFLQLSAGVMVSQLSRDFHLSPFGVGMLTGSFYFVYVILQTPAGMLVDRYGPRRLLGGGGLVCAIGCLCFATSHAVATAFLGRILMGTGASFAFVSSLYLVSQWFPEQRFAIMVGLAETIGMLGTLLGNIYLATMLSHTSWRVAIHLSSVIALLLGALCYIIVKDKPDDEIPKLTTPDTVIDFYKDVKWVLKRSALWLNGLYSGLLFSVVTVFAAFWALPFLQLRQGVSLPIATFECTLIFVGIAVGSPLMGYIYPKVQNKSRFLSLSAIVAAINSSWIIYFTPNSIALSAALFFFLGIICSAYVFNYSIANHVVPKHVRSTSIGFTNTMCVIITPILQPLIGYFLYLVEREHHIVGTGQYSVQQYCIALTTIPLMLILAAFITPYIPEVRLVNVPPVTENLMPIRDYPNTSVSDQPS